MLLIHINADLFMKIKKNKKLFQIFGKKMQEIENCFRKGFR